MESETKPKTKSRVGPPPDLAYCLQYDGPGELTVIGPVTGKRYEFFGAGAVVAVDARDRDYVLAIAGIRALVA